MTKEEARSIDVEQGFHKVYQEESQDFYDGGDYTDLLEVENKRGGNIVTQNGDVLGTMMGSGTTPLGSGRGGWV